MIQKLFKKKMIYENYNNVFDTDGCPDTIQTLLNWAASALAPLMVRLVWRPPRIKVYRPGEHPHDPFGAGALHRRASVERKRPILIIAPAIHGVVDAQPLVDLCDFVAIKQKADFPARG